MEEGKMVQVTIGGEKKSYPFGTSYYEIAKEYQPGAENDIVLVLEDNRLRELGKCLVKDCRLKLLTVADKEGFNAYRRSMTLLLLKALYHEGGHENIEKACIHYAVSSGYYCTVKGKLKVTEEFLSKVKAYMQSLVEKAVPIMKRSINTDEAIALFRQYEMHDKEKLFHYRRVSKVNVYDLDGFEDYYYGYMVPDTSYLRYFDLCLYDEGFVLQMPYLNSPREVPVSYTHLNSFKFFRKSG